MADIVLDLQGGASELLKDLKETRQALIDIKEANATAKKEMQDSFKTPSKDAEAFRNEIEKALKVQMEQKQLIETMTKKMAELEAIEKKAYDSSDVSKYVLKIKDLENEIDQLKKKYKEAGDESQKANTAASQSMIKYLATIDAAKAKLASLSSGSSEYKKLASEIQAAELAQGKLTIAVDENGNALGGSRAELKAMREALIQLKQAGLDTTDIYKSLKNAAGELSDTIGDVNEEFKAAGSDTSGLDKMVRGVQLGINAMGIFQGVTALVGNENEELQKTLIKLNAIMLISQSLQQVMEELKRKDNVLTGVQIVLQKTYAAVVGESTGAMKIFRIALASTGIGLLIVGITALIVKLKQMNDETEKVAESQRLGNEIGKKALDGYVDQEIKMKDLTERATQHGLTKKQEKEILKDYNETFGDSIGKANDFKTAQQNIINLGPKYIDMLKLQAEAHAAFEVAVEKSKGAIEKQLSSLGDFGDWDDNVNKVVNGWFGNEDAAKEIDTRNQKRKDDAIKKDQDDANNALKIMQNKTAEAQKIQDQYHFKTEKAHKDSNKKIQDSNKKMQDDTKKYNDELISLQKQLAQARVNALTDGLDKERQREIIAYNEKVDELLNKKEQAEKLLSKTKNTKEKNLLLKEVDLIDKNIDAETAAHLTKILFIQRAYFDKAQEAYHNAGEAIDDVLKTDQQKEIAAVEKHYEELAEKIKEAKKKAEEYNATSTSGKFDLAEFDSNAVKLEEKMKKEINDINLKYGLQKLDTQEELSIAQTELIEKSGLKEEEIEKLKEISKLQIVIDYSKKKLELLNKAGGDENALQIAQLKKIIKDSEAEIKNLNKEKKFILSGWISNALGIDEDTLKDAVGAYKNMLDGIFEVQKQQQQREIALIDERIDKLNEEIKNQEDIVDKEKELRENGYANNYEIEQQKLQDFIERQEKETKAKEAAQKRYEEIQKREAAVRSASIAAQSIEQSVNLGTAATKIFSAHSGIPFVGVILALAAVAAMVAGFFAIKSSIKSATSSTAETGRRVAKGNRHQSGGNKYMSMDNNDPDILEIEEGEWVVNRESSEQYDPILDAINGRKRVNLPRVQLKRMLAPLGIALEEDIPQKIVQKYEESKSAAVIVVNSDESAQWETQNRILQKIADKSADSVEYTETHRIEKVGNIIRRVKLKK